MKLIHKISRKQNCAVSDGIVKHAIKEMTIVVQNGKRHFARVTATKRETGDPILHVWLWAKGKDISDQLTEEQRRAFIRELFPEHAAAR